MTRSPEQGFDTLAVHAGQEFDPTTGAVIPPVHFTSTYAQDGIGGLRGHEHSQPARQHTQRRALGAGLVGVGLPLELTLDGDVVLSAQDGGLFP